VVARLLPDGYRGDDEAAGEFRRFTEVGLRSGKVDAAQRVLDDLGDTELADRVTVSLDGEAALIWARCLNDLRLSIGTRLEVTEDDEQRFGCARRRRPGPLDLRRVRVAGLVAGVADRGDERAPAGTAP